MDLGVAGRVERPVDDRVAAGRRDGEGRAVGLLGAAIDRVVGGGHTGQSVAAGQADDLACVAPARGAVGLQAGDRGRRRRQVDVDVAGLVDLAVAGRVGGPVDDRVAAGRRDGEGRAVGLLGAAIDRVVGGGHTGQSVAAGQTDDLACIAPAGGAVGLQVRGRRRGGGRVDVDVAGVLGFGVAGRVNRPVAHQVRAFATDQERPAAVELLGAAVDRVVGGDHAGQGVRSVERHRLSGGGPARVVVDLKPGRRGRRRRQVDVDVAALVRALEPGVVGGVEDDAVAAFDAQRHGRRVGGGALHGAPVDAVGDDDRRAVAGAGDRHGGGRVAPAGVVVGREVGGLREWVGDVDPAGLDGLDVAGGVGGPVGHRVLADARDGKGNRVGLRRAAVDGVRDRGHARADAVVGREADRLARRAPVGEVVGSKPSGRGDRRRGVDPQGAATDRARVAGVVEGAVLIDAGPVARAVGRGRHDEGVAGRGAPGGVGLQAVLRAGQARAARVGRAQVHRDGTVVPGPVGVVADGRRRKIDVDVPCLRRLGVADGVDRPVRDRVRALSGHREGARISLPGAAVERVVGGRHAGEAVAAGQAHDLAHVLPAGRGVCLQTGGSRDRRRGVDVHVAGVQRLRVAGPVGRQVGDGVRAVPRDEERGAVEVGHPVDRVGRRRHAGEGVGRGEGHRLAGRLPAGRGARLQARRRRGRRRGIDIDVAGVLGLGVGRAVDRPVDDGVRALSGDAERCRVGLLRASVDRVVGGAHPRLGVGRGQGHGLGGGPPA